MDHYPTTSNARKSLGNAGERLAAEKLKISGYRLVETNWRCRYGEIDIVAWHGNCLTFIEVRTRRGRSAGTPEESIGPRKKATLRRLADAYIQAHPDLLDEHQEPPECRIDMVAVELTQNGVLARVEVLENIIEDEGYSE